jgi:hypothetical protein
LPAVVVFVGGHGLTEVVCHEQVTKFLVEYLPKNATKNAKRVLAHFGNE